MKSNTRIASHSGVRQFDEFSKSLRIPSRLRPRPECFLLEARDQIGLRFLMSFTGTSPIQCQ